MLRETKDYSFFRQNPEKYVKDVNILDAGALTSIRSGKQFMHSNIF